MCKHIYKHTRKKDVSYCIICGCLSYKNIPSLLFQFNNNYEIGFDPLLLKFHHSKKTIDYSNNSNIQYISIRYLGINHIKMLSTYFSISKTLTHKAINYLDQIYLNDPTISLDLIEKISSVCLLLAVKFNECCTMESQINIGDFIHLLSSKINNLNEIEILCLKTLNYELGIYSSYDFINLFFSLGLIFPNYTNINSNCKDSNVMNMYLKCINILEVIIDDYRSLEFTQYNIAISIIAMGVSDSKFFSIETFKYIYGINLLKEKYVKCQLDLKSIYLNNYYFNNRIDFCNRISLNSHDSESTYDNSVSE